MESIAVAKAIANKRGYKVDANQELIALGGANLGGAFFQSFPTTGGFSRTAVNDQSGARTTIASVITAVLIGFTVLFLTPLFYYLPSAVLAAIIMVAVAGLFDAEEMIHLWKTDKRDLTMLSATFLATLFLGIEEGIGIGVLLSLVMVIYSSTQPHSTEVGKLGDTNNYRNVDRYPEAKTDPNILLYRFDSNLYFANVENFRDTMEEKIHTRGDELSLVVIDASSIHSIDSTGVHALKELIEELNERQIRFYLAGVIGPVRDKLKISGVTQAIGEENFFFDVAHAVSYYKDSEKFGPEHQFSPLQTNN
jgi:SulP family sulfate permease